MGLYYSIKNILNLKYKIVIDTLWMQNQSKVNTTHNKAFQANCDDCCEWVMSAKSVDKSQNW